MHLVDVTLYRHLTWKAIRELLDCYVAMVARTLWALSLNRAVRLKILQMSEKDSCWSHQIDIAGQTFLLDQSVDHLCHQGSNLSHCRQLSQQPSSIHTVPILLCSNGLGTICAQLAIQGREFSPTHDRSASSTYTCVANRVLRLRDRLSEDMQMPGGSVVLFTFMRSESL